MVDWIEPWTIVGTWVLTIEHENLTNKVNGYEIRE